MPVAAPILALLWLAAHGTAPEQATPSPGTAAQAPIEEEVLGNILRQPLGQGSVEDLNLPAPFLRRGGTCGARRGGEPDPRPSSRGRGDDPRLAALASRRSSRAARLPRADPRTSLREPAARPPAGWSRRAAAQGGRDRLREALPRRASPHRGPGDRGPRPRAGRGRGRHRDPARRRDPGRLAV